MFPAGGAALRRTPIGTPVGDIQSFEIDFRVMEAIQRIDDFTQLLHFGTREDAGQNRVALRQKLLLVNVESRIHIG